MNFLKSKTTALVAFAMSLFATGHASAYDWATVTGAIDFSGEIAAVAAVVGILAGVFVVRKGARLVLGMIK